jgi:hypothetical protein
MLMQTEHNKEEYFMIEHICATAGRVDPFHLVSAASPFLDFH